MLRHTQFLLKQFLFWMAAFAYSRVVFFIFYADALRLEGVRWWEIFPTLFHAWKLDVSATCYLMVIPFVLCAAQMFSKKSWSARAFLGYNALMLLLYFTTLGGELGIYGEWQSKLSYKALFYLRNPDEIVSSAPTGQLVALALMVIGSAALWTFIFRRWVLDKKLAKVRWRYAVPYMLVTPFLILGGIRGGARPIPIHQSIVYFSKKQILNDIAVNPAWNLVHSVTHGAGMLEKNPFVAMPQGEAEDIVAALHHVEKDTSISVLIVEKPNIVILILESWTGDIVESIGGTAGITPNFGQLEQNGLMFEQLYSGGKRSQQGLAGILAGYPALPQVTVCDFPDKAKRLPTLTQRLNENGYFSSFYFGGQMEYGNIGAFIAFNNFARTVREEDFTGKLHRGKLGVHDEHVLARQLDDLRSEPQPFFSVLFTLSSHSPFDQPLQNALDWDLPQMPFLNSAYYTDKCLGEYFAQARQQPWYDSTLFILIADHGRVSHIPRDFYSFEYVHVPMLFYGEALKPELRGQRIGHLATQADLPKTLLKQLKIDAAPFRWSKDVLNPYTENFAWVEEHVGPGYKRPEGSFVYSFDTHTFINKDLPARDSARIFREGAAYLQVLFQEFIEL
ncbi:MAG: sulfatase-like hydrolase/transferase [Prevotellaceae bacterium]|jgi:phosphoglycerol transferase MdoB-like AlkP superfamily enzyme|nr:sulfatase-like hydrolase/transferase [Prevotellaceae bacterium]